MYYFDTSFLVPLIRPEPSSAAVSKFFSTLDSQELAVSVWTRVELASALAREVRARTLTADEAARSAAQFDVMVERSFSILTADVSDFDLAASYLLKFDTGLRAGDALHLAIATNHGAEAFYTLDKVLNRAGDILHLPVKVGTH